MSLVDDGQLALGTWQGIYLFEHRKRPRDREVALQSVGRLTEKTAVIAISGPPQVD